MSGRARTRLWLMVAAWLALLSFPAQGMSQEPPTAIGETFYVLIYGSQRPVVDVPRYTHSWGTFVRVVGDPCHPETCAVEAFTISWLAVSGEVRVYALKPECGRNWGLEETFDLMLHEGERVSLWGPYQIQRSLYEEALRQKAHLESGAVRYKANDTGYETNQVSNCIHSLSDLAVGQDRLRIGSPGWGEMASYLITRMFLPWIVNPDQTHDWLIPAVGVDKYPLVRRDLENNPTQGILMRSMRNVMYSSRPQLKNYRGCICP